MCSGGSNTNVMIELTLLILKIYALTKRSFCRLVMFRLSYAHIYKIETLTVSVVVASFFIISAFAIYLMVLGFSCLLKRFQSNYLRLF